MWQTIQGYEVLKQQHLQGCGLCCVGMVVNLLGQGKPNERSVYNIMPADARKFYDAATKDRLAGATPTPLSLKAHADKAIHWGRGTRADWIEYALRQHRVKTATAGDHKTAMRAVSAGHPVIVLVRWNRGGGHWVVVVDRKKQRIGKASQYTILDPAGHVVHNTGSTTYTAPYGQAGSFADHFVRCG